MLNCAFQRIKWSDLLRGGCEAHVHLPFLDIVEWLGTNPPSAQTPFVQIFFFVNVACIQEGFFATVVLSLCMQTLSISMDS